MTTLDRNAIRRLSAGELTSRLYDLRATERALLVEFLSYLGELDARKIYLELGFSSAFAFCTDHLWPVAFGRRHLEPRRRAQGAAG